MPTLDPSYIGTWYFFVDAEGDTAGTYRIFETWSEKERVEIQPVKLLQGDIGTHVMSVGGHVWETQVASPVVVLDTFTSTDNTPAPTILSAFDLLLDAFATIRDPALLATASYVLKDATIEFSEKGTTVEMTFLSDKGIGTDQGVFTPLSPASVLNNGTADFIARTAMFYDTIFFMTDDFVDPYQVLDGKIEISVDVKENYFINHDQTVWLSVQGYHVNGNVKLLGYPTGQSLPGGTQRLNIPYQPFGEFNPITYGPTALQIGGSIITFGSSSLNSYVNRSVAPDQVTTIDVGFECFVRYQGS